MKVPYDQCLANQIGPAPCADVRDGMGEASGRGSAGWVLSRERNTFETLTLWVMGEGNMVRNAHGEFRGRSRVVIDPRHVQTLVMRMHARHDAWEPGDLSFGRWHSAVGPHRGGH
jgi:hypothetical protein